MNTSNVYVRIALSALLMALALMLLLPGHVRAADSLLNVSYDVSRSVYKDLNPAFAAFWEKKTGAKLKIDQSHGGSSKQARSIIDGLEADVVTMNNPLDIDAIAERGKSLPANWATLLPHGASPSWSTILFVVRKGNPKQIRDWDDLAKSGVSVILPNPKTSGNGRYRRTRSTKTASCRAPGSEPMSTKPSPSKCTAPAPSSSTVARSRWT